MTTKNEALKLALEALETLPAGSSYKTHNAASALRQALAQPEQEPFEMKWPDYNESAMGCGIEDRNITDRYEAMQYGWDEAISRVSECLPDVLFTAPPSKPWVSLTNEEIFDLADHYGEFKYGDAQGHKRIGFARAIEAKLKGKNRVDL